LPCLRTRAKASIAWAIKIPMLRTMNVLAKAEYMARLLQYEVEAHETLHSPVEEFEAQQPNYNMRNEAVMEALDRSEELSRNECSARASHSVEGGYHAKARCTVNVATIRTSTMDRTSSDLTLLAEWACWSSISLVVRTNRTSETAMMPMPTRMRASPS